jgi:hypothetical protein
MLRYRQSWQLPPDYNNTEHAGLLSATTARWSQLRAQLPT